MAIGEIEGGPLRQGRVLVYKRNSDLWEQIGDEIVGEGSGDHFGEIGLIYRCKRTASIISRNYDVFARLSKENWRELVNEEPKFLGYLRAYCQLYDDVNI